MSGLDLVVLEENVCAELVDGLINDVEVGCIVVVVGILGLDWEKREVARELEVWRVEFGVVRHKDRLLRKMQRLDKR